MEERPNTEDLRRSLEEILDLSLRTARSLRRVLEEQAPRQPETGVELCEVAPDEGLKPS